MSKPQAIAAESAEPASDYEVFLCEWAKETLKRNIPFLNDTLQRLVTLNATFLGLSLLLLKEQVIAMWSCVAAMLCLLISLVASFWGMLPFPAVFSFQDLGEIIAQRDRATDWKVKCTRVGAVSFVLAFIAAFVGVLTK
jgi:hypothetical protein